MCYFKQLRLNQIRDEFKTIAASAERQILLCSSSFDERCLVASSQFQEDDFVKVIVAKYQNNYDALQNNIEKIQNQFGKKYHEMHLYTDEPIISADNIQSVLSEILGLDNIPTCILCDVTSFTRESILMLFAFFRSLNAPNIKIYFIYSRAKTYPMWLSKGIKEVRSVLGFSGQLRPSLKNHLIILAGFELERAVNIVQEFEPYKVSIGIGLKDQQIDENYNKAKEMLDSFLSNFSIAEQFEFDICNPFTCKENIQSQIHSSGCNTIIAPMNTKVSTIGTALFAFENPDTQLCYAAPEMYNFDKIEPSEDCIFFEIQFTAQILAR